MGNCLFLSSGNAAKVLPYFKRCHPKGVTPVQKVSPLLKGLKLLTFIVCIVKKGAEKGVTPSSRSKLNDIQFLRKNGGRYAERFHKL
jgi:hypothetical protein